jgi:hypothetical protein
MSWCSGRMRCRCCKLDLAWAQPGVCEGLAEATRVQPESVTVQHLGLPCTAKQQGPSQSLQGCSSSAQVFCLAQPKPQGRSLASARVQPKPRGRSQSLQGSNSAVLVISRKQPHKGTARHLQGYIPNHKGVAHQEQPKPQGHSPASTRAHPKPQGHSPPSHKGSGQATRAQAGVCKGAEQATRVQPKPQGRSQSLQ